MYLVCPKCRRAVPAPLAKTGFNCTLCKHAWEPPAMEFAAAYFCELPALAVALRAASGERFPISSFPATVGRDSDFKELQRNRAVSREHFRVNVSDDGITVTDLGSRGGTFLNAAQLPANTPHPFTPADTLCVSGVELTLELSFCPPAPQPPADQPGPETIHLPNSASRMTVGGPLSPADIKIQGCEAPKPIACFYTPPQGSGWALLALEHGAVTVNGEPILACTLQPDDEVSLGPFRYRYSPEGTALRPVAAADTVGLAARKIGFSVRTPTGPKAILAGATLDIPAGRLTAIIGASGSGKSTLAKILIGALVAESGELLFAGQSIAPPAYPERVAGLIAFVPQEDIVHPELTIQETLDYAASIRLSGHATPAEKAARVARILDELDLLDHRDKPVSALSGGQRKRVNVAVELLSSPQILFLDEPTTGLDTGTEEQILTCLRRLACQGRTVVFITHSLPAMDQADHVVILHADSAGGRVLAQGAPGLLKRQHRLADWSALFPRSETRSTQTPPAAVRPTKALAKLALKSPGFLTLLLRYVSIWAAKPIASFLILLGLPALLGLLIRIAVPTDGPAGHDRILFGVICAFWLGMNQTVREIVKERTIMLREQFAGVATASYLFSKVGFFFVIAFFQAGLLAAPMLWLRVEGMDITVVHSEMECPVSIFWCVLWAGLCAGASLGLFLSTACLFIRGQGEIWAVLLVILVTLPQILFSPKVLGDLVEKTADYHAFIFIDSDRKLAEIASYFTASRYLYLPLAAYQNLKGDYAAILTFNGAILAAFSLCCLILAWLTLELFIHHKRTQTHW
ncbi:MAG: ABC transporter ATP-binding/permease protein [Betaproteobacteria bacterium ADurb.Bin341]|nr:MAG: ABC transporter ATP-binding/permease protein [Betaproteobacteria bacterium ADurb.Bin341]